MTTTYRLYPPFLYTPEGDDFSDVWEILCCKLLNIEHKTSEIYIRSPPEQGVDIYYPSKNIAYQCKSVESGKPGDFNTSHAVASYKTAVVNQSIIGWTQYVLCTNVDLTGTAEKKLRTDIPGLVILPASHWRNLCENNEHAVARNFQSIISLHRGNSKPSTIYKINTCFGPAHAVENDDDYSIILYTNRHDLIYEVPVKSSTLVDDLLQKVIQFFDLPRSEKFDGLNFSMSLMHTLLIDGKQLNAGKTLKDLNVKKGSVLTYWTQIRLREGGREVDYDVMNLELAGPLKLTRKERFNQAHDSAKNLLRIRLKQLD